MKEEVVYINNKNSFTIFKLERKTVTDIKEKRFSFYKQVSGFYKPDTEVQVFWDGLNPNSIGIQIYEVEKRTQEKEKLVENDGFIKVSNIEYKYEFNQAARRGKIRVVADASFNREFSPEVAAAAWVIETKYCKYQWEGSGLMKAKNNS